MYVPYKGSIFTYTFPKIVITLQQHKNTKNQNQLQQCLMPYNVDNLHQL